jgi:hypothetical protein
MADEGQLDQECSELRLPLRAIVEAEQFRDRGVPSALRVFVHDRHGPFLDLFTEKGIAEGYVRKANLPTWTAVELSTPADVRSAILACEQRGCHCVGLDCTGYRDANGRFFTSHHFLTLIDRSS